jgi:hypothetical protein
LDGTLFKAIVNWTFFQDQTDQHCQDVISVHLDSIEDIDVPAIQGGVPRRGAAVSLELDYPDSPSACPL